MVSADEEFLNELAQRLHDCKVFERLRLLKLVRACLADQGDNIEVLKEGQWVKLVRDSIFEVLERRLSEQYTNEALELAAQMTLSFDGVDWVQCGDTWDRTNSKILILILRLACVELQVIVPELIRLTPEERASPSNARVGSMLILFEKFFIGFAHNIDDGDNDQRIYEDSYLKIGKQTVLTVLDAVRDTMRDILQFITTLSRRTDPLEADLQNLLFAAIRVTMCYFTEEQGILKDLFIPLLTFIFKTVKNNEVLSHIDAVEIVKVGFKAPPFREALEDHDIDYNSLQEMYDNA